MSQPSRRSLEYIVPRIYVSLPNIGQAEITLSNEDSPIERSFVADLVILYAFDLDTHFEIVANRDLPMLGISAHKLHELAIDNLRSQDIKIEAHRRDRIFMLTAGGNYEAVMLLLPEVWNSIASMVSGQIVASVPARDLLFVTGDADQENLAELRRCTSKALEIAAKPLSRHFLLRDGKSWRKYTGFAE